MSRSLHLKHTGRSPTRAGFTGSSSLLGQVLLDHPRSRGVYPDGGFQVGDIVGSSPLARGLRVMLFLVDTVLGIIPARAGFTYPWVMRTKQLPDHPRSRGVYRVRFWEMTLSKGSSPLARGLLLGGHPSHPPSRIIPARAGFTQARRHARHRPRDHPRSRGVYPNTKSPTSTARGSSPLARGLLKRDGENIDGRGIIPARAGFTHPRSTRPPRKPDHPRSRGVYYGFT